MEGSGSGAEVGTSVVENGGPSSTSSSGGMESTTAVDSGSNSDTSTETAAGADDTGWWPAEGCNPARPSIEVLSPTTPDGEFVPADGSHGYDYCTRQPFLQLFDRESRKIGILVLPGTGESDPYQGRHDAGFIRMDYHPVLDAIGRIEFLEPLDRTSPPGNARLHAFIEVHDGGWDYAAEVDLPYCDPANTCSCPCE
jgi:hypothetical protein